MQPKLLPGARLHKLTTIYSSIEALNWCTFIRIKNWFIFNRNCYLVHVGKVKS